MTEPMFKQHVELREPEEWERTMSCNGCARHGEVVAVLDLGRRDGGYQPSGFEWRMCQTCQDEFYEAVVGTLDSLALDDGRYVRVGYDPVDHADREGQPRPEK